MTILICSPKIGSQNQLIKAQITAPTLFYYMNNRTANLILFIVTLIAASGWFFSKNSLVELPSIGFIGLRFSLAFLLFLPFSYKQLSQLPSPALLRASSVGLANLLNIILWILGLTYSQYFGEGAFLVSLAMLIAPLLSWMLFKQKPQRIFYVSLFFAFVGLYCLSAENGAFRFSLGSAIFLLSSLSAALYFVLNNQFARNIPPLALTTVQLGVVGIFAVAYSVLFEPWPSTISNETWLWFSGSVLIATNLRVLLQTIGQRYCNVANAALIMLLEPVWTLALSHLVLNETLSVVKLLGCVLILFALILYKISGRLKIFNR